MTLKYFFHTIRYLRPIQIYGRVWFKLYHPKPDLRSAPLLRSQLKQWCEPAHRPSSLFSPVQFHFLNETHALTTAQAWNHPTWEKLWLYNLHYFDDLNAKEAEKRESWHRALIERWIQENPPAHGNGWEPYPLSLRIINWIKWASSGHELSSSWIHSLAIQVRYLYQRLEIHLLGNHLFANAKALIFSGLFFQGVEAEKWLRKGLELLHRELSEQILADGGHFECSPMYHSIILEDVLDLINIMRVYDYEQPDWQEIVQNMRSWLKALCHPDGQIAFFNDAAFEIAPAPQELESYAHRLALGNIKKIDLGESGYISLQNDVAVALLDVGKIRPDYLPGHAHADTLSFECSLFGQRFLVNSGTSCYGVSSERLRQRATYAHNTVVLNKQNSSEVWSGFRVARRAKPYGLRWNGANTVTCAHDGYKRLSGKPVHWRTWTLRKHALVIQDRIEGIFQEAIAYYHFHPDIIMNTNVAILPNGQEIMWEIQGGVGKIQPSTYHPKFGVNLSNDCLAVTFIQSECTLIFRWL
ncbi:MAG: alginate lyase family protein [Thiomargarita sp.]|nr:alginate lyase family protein [Thiomargarita sp.]